MRRIALDEAHCFVTWGDDFRPSFKRAEQLILDIKTLNPKLQIIALTATATPTVQAGLRDRFFSSKDNLNEHYCEVRGDPIRGNLALYRLNLTEGDGGRVSQASIVEEVVSTVRGHTILYTLTVKEANSLYNHIRTYLGEAERDRVQLFHGRLSDHDKAIVSNAFRDAPTQEDDAEGFQPLIVVATSAFGLGIDRPDVRTVFCVSPPADLSALYQQVGRAGRDGDPAFGLMLATRRSFSTIDFMTRSTLQLELIDRIARRILDDHPPLNMANLATEFVSEDLHAGRIPSRESIHAEGRYRTYVARVFAELHALGNIADLGDFPDHVKIAKIELESIEPEIQDFLDALWSGADRPLNQDLLSLWKQVEWVSLDIHDPGQLWSGLLALHAGGYVDVSQQVTQNYLTHYEIRDGSLPPDFPRRFERRHQDLTAEVNRLKSFFGEEHCVNQSLAQYFSVTLDHGPCEAPETRCSDCWGRLEAEGQPPLLHQAFMKPPQRRGAADERRQREQRRLEQDILLVLKAQRHLGLSAKYLIKTLKGEDQVADPDGSGGIKWNPLWPSLIYHRAFGAFPGIKDRDVNAALNRLASRGEVTLREDRRWVVPRFVP